MDNFRIEKHEISSVVNMVRASLKGLFAMAAMNAIRSHPRDVHLGQTAVA